ncbi:Hypothetical protein CAP_3513 [Chondromyces apiculatus DSM 436]|uniref:Uncharacterized protein n=1 Tax=Chondromyces apiculatus DSM 436 TaxID=1192034 RepID=A0A017T7C2_9BACT|nr:Hypothetical protein CAP_3513 [Chondromyces apiculatus DSM 436]
MDASPLRGLHTLCWRRFRRHPRSLGGSWLRRGRSRDGAPRPWPRDGMVWRRVGAACRHEEHAEEREPGAQDAHDGRTLHEPRGGSSALTPENPPLRVSPPRIAPHATRTACAVCAARELTCAPARSSAIFVA